MVGLITKMKNSFPLSRIYHLAYSAYNKLSSRKRYWFHFAVLMGIMLVYCAFAKPPLFYYDSAVYWGLAESFIKDGTFKFTHYFEEDGSTALRGYFFPFLLLILRKIAELILFNQKVGALYLFNSALFALLSLTIYPKVASLAFSGKKSDVKDSYIFAFFVFFFWRGHFLYPLSDFPALIFFTLGLIFVHKSLTSHRLWLYALCAGLFFAAAGNTRPNYFSGVLLLPLFWLSFSVPLSKKIQSLIFTLCGFFCLLAPQIAINKTYFNTFSPLSKPLSSKGTSLMTMQLIWGLSYQKYETYVGPKLGGAVQYFDPITPKLLEDAGMAYEDLETFADYLKFVSKYPLDMLIVYVRHFFNALDIVYPTAYIFDISKNRFLFSLLNYFLLFLGLCALWRHLESFKWKYLCEPVNVLFILAFGLTVPGILGAIEVRFSLPIFMLIYGVAVRVLTKIRRPKINEVIFCLLFISFSFAMSTLTLATYPKIFNILSK